MPRVSTAWSRPRSRTCSTCPGSGSSARSCSRTTPRATSSRRARHPTPGRMVVGVGEADMALEAYPTVTKAVTYGTFWREMPDDPSIALDHDEQRVKELTMDASPKANSVEALCGGDREEAGLANKTIGVDERGAKRDLLEQLAARFPNATFKPASQVVPAHPDGQDRRKSSRGMRATLRRDRVRLQRDHRRASTRASPSASCPRLRARDRRGRRTAGLHAAPLRPRHGARPDGARRHEAHQGRLPLVRHRLHARTATAPTSAAWSAFGEPDPRAATLLRRDQSRPGAARSS